MKRILIATLFLIAPAICSAQPADTAPPGSTPSAPAATPPIPDSSNSVVLPSTKGMASHFCRPDRWFLSVHGDEKGVATLFFRIDATGKVESITLKTSSGYSSIDNGAIACTSRWQYVPAELNGNPIETFWGADVLYSPGGPPRLRGPYLDPSLRFCPGYPNSSVPNLKPTVILLTTGTGGDQGGASIVQSSGDPSLDQFALACASTASFKQDLASVQPKPGSLLVPIFWPAQSK